MTSDLPSQSRDPGRDRRRTLLSTFRPGQVRRGTVTSIPHFGVFVDLGGVDGLINVAELSWTHYNHPGEIVEVGQEITVEVLHVDMARERMSLSLRALRENPWPEFRRAHRNGPVVVGEVTRLAPFGVFVRVADGFNGLVHNDALGDLQVRLGDELRVRVVDVDPDRRRIRLSLAEAGRDG
ncbi:S1 RNA-binding domain-containing protein [Sinosporangium siamense]|uniref:S1 motif domain-containing protein n=1 Tax=Sinosporangium siamense TaxID=1367973 RepID=A0A919V9I8_9ACTN|nr:S1 RNA-binding domain-containing protein [Sinosporangium siamense]GII94352.1 hypothetical protein Ssi02_45830 [Sinosporangium siamense]